MVAPNPIARPVARRVCVFVGLGTAVILAVAAALWLLLGERPAADDRSRLVGVSARRRSRLCATTWATHRAGTAIPAEYRGPHQLGAFESLAARRAGRPPSPLGRPDGRGPRTARASSGPMACRTAGCGPNCATGRGSAAARSAAERFVIDYAFGSGRHAITLVSLLDRDPRHPIIREHRLTFFAHSARRA